MSESISNSKLENVDNKIEAQKFFEQLKYRDDVALIFLKGGDRGGLNSDVKTEILNKVDQWFDVTPGEEKELAFNEVVSRWGKGYLKYPTMEVAKENPKLNEDFLKKGEELLHKKNESGFKDWLTEASNIVDDDVGLLRLEMLMAYYSSGGQNILLKLKKGINREKILADLNINSEEVESDLSFQEFVKMIVVGDTTAKNAKPGTLRSIAYEKMEENGLLTFANLWEEPKDKWALRVKLSDPKTVASNLLNAIHSPGSIEELELEVELLGKKDLEKFNDALQADLDRLDVIPEYELDDGIKKIEEQINEKMKDNSEPMVIEVAGGSASGKTSQVAEKVKGFYGNEALILSMDDYYYGKAYMEREAQKNNKLTWDQPEALNIELLKNHIEQLKQNKEIEKPVYDMKISEVIGYEQLKPRKVIIIEGLFALNDQIESVGDVKVFVDIGTHGRILRRLLRDTERTNQKPADILKYFAEVVEPMHEKYIQKSKQNANMIIKNEYSPSIEAQRSGLHEVQLKFEASISEEELIKLGAEKISYSSQSDSYYNPKDRNLLDTEEILRIRKEGNHQILTYKGPRVKSEFRKRPKFEFEIDQNTKDMFLSIYGHKSKNINKERTLYQLDDVIFAVDKVVSEEDGMIKNLGNFIEIRSTDKIVSEKELKNVIKKLGLDFNKKIQNSYFEM